MLRAFTTNTEYIPQCKAILDASASPYAQHFAASSLTRLVTENALTPQLRLDVRHYVLQLLAARGVTLEAFVATGALL